MSDQKAWDTLYKFVDMTGTHVFQAWRCALHALNLSLAAAIISLINSLIIAWILAQMWKGTP